MAWRAHLNIQLAMHGKLCGRPAEVQGPKRASPLDAPVVDATVTERPLTGRVGFIVSSYATDARMTDGSGTWQDPAHRDRTGWRNA
jgi:hypothetical protein